MARAYWEHLRSNGWQQLRTRELKRAGHVCERCGVSSRSRALQVHHRHYRSVGEEQPGDLEVLCAPCHNRVHDGGRFDPAIPAWGKDNPWLARILVAVNARSRSQKDVQP